MRTEPQVAELLGKGTKANAFEEGGPQLAPGCGAACSLAQLLGCRCHIHLQARKHPIRPLHHHRVPTAYILHPLKRLNGCCSDKA